VQDRLRIIDATHLAAKVDLFRLPPNLSDDGPARAAASPDSDARFGRKSATKSFYGYKEHLATDADSELGKPLTGYQYGTTFHLCPGTSGNTLCRDSGCN
jgi:hypothetical protein